MPHPRAGFTLIELAIVLTIIALIVGGVVLGQSLIQEGQMQNILSERTKYANAIGAFQEKYKAVPGDMPDAYEFWGATCGTDTTDPSTGCNGNGDGSVLSNENVKLWEHVVLAKLVEGTYDGTGTNNGSGGIYLSKTNSMKSAFADGYWEATSNTPGVPAPQGKLFLRYGGLLPGGQISIYYNPNLTHGNASQIDTKIDDGQANKGRTQGSTAANCSDNGTDYYRIVALGEDYKGDCILTFTVQ